MAINRKEKPKKKGKGMKGMSIKSGDKRQLNKEQVLQQKVSLNIGGKIQEVNFRLQLLKKNQEVKVEQQEEKVFVQGQQDK